MAFPLVDKDESKTESHTLVVDGSNKSVTLDYRARGQYILSDGTTSASTISVARGDVTYTEVFALPVSSGNYFYHEDDAVNETSKLVFHSDQSGSVSVTYSTKGSRVLASYAGMWWPDVPIAIISGTVAEADWDTLVINSGPTIYGKAVDCSTYTSDASSAVVQVTTALSSASGTSLPTVGYYIKGAAGYADTTIVVGSSNVPSSSIWELSYTITIPSTAPAP